MFSQHSGVYYRSGSFFNGQVFFRTASFWGQVLFTKNIRIHKVQALTQSKTRKNYGFSVINQKLKMRTVKCLDTSSCSLEIHYKWIPFYDFSEGNLISRKNMSCDKDVTLPGWLDEITDVGFTPITISKQSHLLFLLFDL